MLIPFENERAVIVDRRVKRRTEFEHFPAVDFAVLCQFGFTVGDISYFIFRRKSLCRGLSDLIRWRTRPNPSTSKKLPKTVRGVFNKDTQEL